MSEKITLYPSNWLYNAGVIGFLRVLEKINYKEYEFNENGFIEIKKDGLNSDKIFIKWDDLTKEKINESYKGKSGGTKNWYYANQTEKSIKEKIEALLEKRESPRKSPKKGKGFYLSCSICGDSEITNKSLLNKKVLTQAYGNILLASAKTFPNSYWMLKSREFVCSKCEFILMCHHIPFITIEEEKKEKKRKKEEKEEIFINAPDFKLIWDLNKFAEEVLQKSKEYEIRKILGSSLLQWAIKRRALLGAWTMMNIEVIVKRRVKKDNKFEDIIDYFDLPQDITKILLDYEIADLIKRIDEEKIFDLILAGKFSELEKANYFVLKTILKLKDKKEISENDPITKYFTITKYNDLDYLKNYLKKVSGILPELYVKILEKIRR